MDNRQYGIISVPIKVQICSGTPLNRGESLSFILKQNASNPIQTQANTKPYGMLGSAPTPRRSRPRRTSLRLVALLCCLFASMNTTTVRGGIGSWRKKTSQEEPDEGESGVVNASSSPEANGSSNHNHMSNSEHQYHKTYLDLFGETAKDFLTRVAPERISRIVPPEEPGCRWDWRYLRCEPYCACTLSPKFPWDLHLGRACRKRGGAEGTDGGTEAGFEEGADYRGLCEGGDSRPGSTLLSVLRSPAPFLAKTSGAAWRILRTRADPVVARAAGELERVGAGVSAVVCGDLSDRCKDGGDGAEGPPPVLAWQERLVCREIARDCGLVPPSRGPDPAEA
ncbi:unnamed protein product [Pseudo-nitzschia multistriata]|uniref:Uncharacterized protein n=1 Tax=Pseudo-nitzschia multistriata TaxID=183589 RepID=A0A448Z327_9STRA|nr:unnamed protein product [Pseudo-nitzschia multistriata]